MSILSISRSASPPVVFSPVSLSAICCTPIIQCCCVVAPRDHVNVDTGVRRIAKYLPHDLTLRYLLPPAAPRGTENDLSDLVLLRILDDRGCSVVGGQVVPLGT